MLKAFIAYIKDNPKGYWFKRKLYGWGWVPARREGWLVILLFVVALGLNAYFLGEDPGEEDLFRFFAGLIVSVGLLLLVCYRTGEKPKWQWGVPEKYKK